MNDDYFTKLDEQLAALTSEGAHLDRRAWWRPVDRAARRTVAALGLVVLLAALLVIEFPGSASGSARRATVQAAQTAQTAQAAQTAQTVPATIASGPAAASSPAPGRVA
jgi:type II secretory pathway component PulM